MLKIDKYYDIRCDKCLMARSSDIDGGLGMWTGTADTFRKQLAREGWKSHNGQTLCPKCSLKGGK